ncbi:MULTISPECIES: thioredoxin family protein [unclassified Iodidimonas]|jgi:thiol:disulfide interchange protein|uniref:thioredoxin family protein n=1 Tax=unclassified Iodidimonas TaxID=2626145 RepID=UPI0024830DD7|nr:MULTISPECIES: thioredoxin family protein [unclassified Iodidimonas]
MGKGKILALLLVVLGAVLAVSPLGSLLYMNVRGADPLLAQWQDYEPVAFEGALQAGDPVLVQIYASWCPTCEAQHQSFTALENKGRVPDARLFRVDFDRDGAFLEKHEVQSTGLLLVFRNGVEVARQGGLVDEGSILSFLESQSVDI